MVPIKNHENYLITKDGEVYSKRREIYLSPNNNGNGYFTVMLGRSRRRHYIHRLVAEAYLLNPNNLPEVNHKNGNKGDNRIENLEWVSRKDNIKHSIHSGLTKPQKGKLNDEQKSIVKRMYATKVFSQQKIADIFNVSQETIWRILKH